MKLWLGCDMIQEWQHKKWYIEPAAYACITCQCITCQCITCQWLFTWTLVPPARCTPRENHERSRFVVFILVHQHLRISSTEYVYMEVYMLVTNWKYISYIEHKSLLNYHKSIFIKVSQQPWNVLSWVVSHLGSTWLYILDGRCGCFAKMMHIA